MPDYVSKAGGVGLAYVLTYDDLGSLTASIADTGSFVVTASFANPFLSFSKGDGTQFYLNLETLVPISALTASFITGSGVHGPYGPNSVISASYAITSSYAVSASYASTATTASYSLNTLPAGGPFEIQYNGGSGSLEASTNLNYVEKNEVYLRSLSDDGSGFLRKHGGIRLQDSNATILVRGMTARQVVVHRSARHSENKLILQMYTDLVFRAGFVASYIIACLNGSTRAGQLYCSWTGRADNTTADDISLVDLNNVGSTLYSPATTPVFRVVYDPTGKVYLYLDCTHTVENTDVCILYTLFTEPD